VSRLGSELAETVVERMGIVPTILMNGRIGFRWFLWPNIQFSQLEIYLGHKHLTLLRVSLHVKNGVRGNKHKQSTQGNLVRQRWGENAQI